MERTVSRLGDYGDEGNSVYRHSIPFVGGNEEVERAAERGESQSGRERGIRELVRGGGSSDDNTVGRAEDEADAG